MARVYVDSKTDPCGTAAKRKPQKSVSPKKRMAKCAKRFSSDLSRKATEAELVFKSILDFATIRYTFQKPILKGDHFYIADFYLNDYATIVEIDDGYHDTAKQAQKDALRAEDILKKTSIARIIRLSNDQLFSLSTDDILNILAEQLCPWNPVD